MSDHEDALFFQSFVSVFVTIRTQERRVQVGVGEEGRLPLAYSGAAPQLWLRVILERK